MLCEYCKEREANVKYTQIVNGVKKEMFLCDKCSKELEIGDMSFNMPIDFSSFFGDFINEYNNSFMPLLTKQKPVRCDNCKMTFDEFVNQGKFGCSHCYDTFSENIDTILKRLHGSNRYVGRKVSKKDETNIALENETSVEDEKIKELKSIIKKLIKEEKYEEAAKVRDEIKKIEEERKK